MSNRVECRVYTIGKGDENSMKKIIPYISVFIMFILLVFNIIRSLISNESILNANIVIIACSFFALAIILWITTFLERRSKVNIVGSNKREKDLTSPDETLQKIYLILASIYKDGKSSSKLMVISVVVAIISTFITALPYLESELTHLFLKHKDNITISFEEDYNELLNTYEECLKNYGNCHDTYNDIKNDYRDMENIYNNCQNAYNNEQFTEFMNNYNEFVEYHDDILQKCIFLTDENSKIKTQCLSYIIKSTTFAQKYSKDFLDENGNQISSYEVTGETLVFAAMFFNISDMSADLTDKINSIAGKNREVLLIIEDIRDKSNHIMTQVMTLE